MRPAEAIVDHPGIDKIAFTGSTGVGKMIARSIAGTRKKATLELGGKAANIIFDDAPVDQAIEGIVNGIFFNQGQVCCAGSRLFVQESIADEVERKLSKPGWQPCGSATRWTRTPTWARSTAAANSTGSPRLSAVGEAEGATRWDNGCPLPKNGIWFRVNGFTGGPDPPNRAQEIFGPVLSVLTFRTPVRPVAKANNTPYGLSAGI